MTRSIRPALIALFALLFSALPAFAFSLNEVEQDVKADYPSVEHVTPEALSSRSDTVVFDVRETSEFAVSHLSGAIQLPPNFSRRAFMKRYGALTAGKRVIFYCSVGVRSSEMAERLQLALRQAGAKSISNLSGGIFRWHNEKRSLQNASGKTDAVHPYNRRWGKLLQRRELISYRPKSP